MKINEIIVESSEDIRLMICLAGFDLSEIEANCAKVKNQFLLKPNDPRYRRGMKQFLTELNLKLIEVSEMSQWESWALTTDGKELQRVMNDLYNDNIAFITKYS